MKIVTTGNIYDKPLMVDKPEPILIVGGGWAGLTCAVELASLGHAVTVLESARQLGGRARRVAFADHAVDNGQHVFVGAYHHTLELLKRLGVPLQQSLHRQVLDLYLQQHDSHAFQLRLPHLLTPLNL